MLQGFTQALLDAVPDALLAVDLLSDSLVAANRTCEDLFERSNEELLKTPFSELIDTAERESTRSLFSGLASTHSVHLGRLTIVTGKGQKVSCEIHSRIAQDSPPIIVLALRSIAGREATSDAHGAAFLQAEEALRESERRNRALLRAVPDPIFRLDLNGLILDYKYDGRDELLLPRDQIIGANIFDLPLEETDKSRIGQAIAQTISTGDLQSAEYAITQDGELRLFEARFVAEEEGRVVAIVREVTSQRRSEETMARIEKLEALGMLAGGIAHDFNNLVAGAFGHVEMAREYIIEDKVTSAVDCLAEAAGTFNRARELTRQLLTFSKGGAPQKRPGNLGTFVRRTIESALAGSNLQPNITEAEPTHSVAFDENQIAQVLDNLVVNARHSMPLGGKLEVSIDIVQVNVGTSLPLSVGTYSRISIKDAGIGIPLENMPKLFDPFFTTKPGGTGLGLASSFSIIKRHGGHLDVQSEIGKGTTCHVYLPHDAETLTEPRNITSNRPTRQGRILVMDDEDTVRRVTCALLMRLGYEVVPAADGGEAIEIYRRTITSGNRFAFRILDLTVPGGLGGRETLESINEMDPNVIAIATTGYSNDPILANPEAYGFRAGLAKPYSRQEFIGLIGRVTG
jgi:PAS domain S-box-containing protein